MKNINFKVLRTRFIAIFMVSILMFSIIPGLSVSAKRKNVSTPIQHYSPTIIELLEEDKLLPEISESSPYNEIDALVFSSLAYLPMNPVPKFCSENDSFTIKNFADELLPILDGDEDISCLEKYPEELQMWNIYLKYSADTERNIDIVKLLKLVSVNTRYKDIKMSNAYCKFYKDVKNDVIEQFAGVVFDLPNGTKVVTYRGTDTSLAGWKEDLDLAWSDYINSQQYAKLYLSVLSDMYEDCKFAITGHSKGGNLAIYSSLMLIDSGIDPNRIVSVYNLDGPGLRKDLIQRYNDQYKILKTKLVNFVPQNSIVGMILNNKDEKSDYQCVYSSYKGIFQHDSFSWHINYDLIESGIKFEIADGNTTNRNSKFLEAIITKFLNKVTREDMGAFSNTLFRCMGYEDPSSVMLGPTVLKNLMNFKTISALYKLKGTEKETFKMVLSKLVEAIQETDMKTSSTWDTVNYIVDSIQ